MAGYRGLREEAWRANLEIPRLGLAILTWGNASAFDADAGVFAIKPSGVDYAELTTESMVVLDLEGRVVEGRLRPSSDAETHMVLYRRLAGLRGVCHSHSTYATAWAQARRPIPCLGTTHADLVAGEVPCTALLDPEALAAGYELATGELIADTLGGAQSLERPVILVAGHGPFAWAGGAMGAVRAAASLEEIAKMAWVTLGIDPSARPLPEYVMRKHFERKHGPGAYYGQSS